MRFSGTPSITLNMQQATRTQRNVDETYNKNALSVVQYRTATDNYLMN